MAAGVCRPSCFATSEVDADMGLLQVQSHASSNQYEQDEQGYERSRPIGGVPCMCLLFYTFQYSAEKLRILLGSLLINT